MGFSKEECKYTKFHIENHEVTFEGDSGEGVCVSVPFADDTPQCIKEKLNSIIYQELNRHLELAECAGIWLPCNWLPCNLMLNARMLTQYYNQNVLTTKYFISILITDLQPGMGAGTWIDQTIDICNETTEFLNEFKSYCRDKVEQVLFPM